VGIYLVTYDVKDNDRRKEIQATLNSKTETFNSIMLCESSYLIDTTMDIGGIHQIFENKYAQEDSFYTFSIHEMPMGHPANSEVGAWLNEKFKKSIKKWSEIV